jgi:hypothetical protein
VFHDVLGYAAELEELSANPLDRVKWKPPKVAEVVDRRVVVNPHQARELLTAVTYIGRPWRGRHLRAFFACMYFAALRPGEVKALRKDGCFLPASGWSGSPCPGHDRSRIGAGPIAGKHSMTAA